MKVRYPSIWEISCCKFPLFCMFAFFILGMGTAQATNWVTWATNMCRKSPLALTRLLDDSKDIKDACKAAADTLEVSQIYDIGTFLASPDSIYRDGMLLIDGNPAKFGKFDRKNYKNKLFAARWKIPLKAGQQFILCISGDFAVVFHNGTLLDYHGGDLWGGKSSSYLTAKGGDEIVALAASDVRGDPWIKVYPGPYGRAVAARAQEIFGKGLNENSVRMIDDLLYRSYRTAWADPKLIAEGFVGFYKYLESIRSDDKLFGRFQKDYRDHLNWAVSDCWLGMPLEFMPQIRKEAGEEAFALPFWYMNKLERRASQRYWQLLLDSGDEKQLLEFITWQMKLVGNGSEKDTELAKQFASLSAGVYDFASRTIYSRKNTTVGIALCDLFIKAYTGDDNNNDVGKKEAQPKKKKSRAGLFARYKSLKDKFLWLSRVEGTGLFYSDNQMTLGEFSSMLKNYRPGDKLALGRIFDFYRKHGATLTVVGDRAIAMRLFMLNELEKNQELLKTLQEYAGVYLQQQLPAAGQLLNVASLDQALKDCYGLADFTEARLRLMRENLDLCRLSAARHHALCALQSLKREYRVQAMTSLMLIESELKLTPQARTPLPADLKSERVSLAGERMSMAEMSRRFGASDTPGVAARAKEDTAENGPGRLFSRIPSESRDYMVMRTVSGLSDMAVVSDAYQAQAVAASGKEANKAGNSWDYYFDGLLSKHDFRIRSSAVPLGQGIAFLAPSESRNNVVSLDEKGRKQWSSGDFAYEGGLEPLCVPAQVLGMHYVRAVRQINDTMAECGVAQLDVANGRMSGFIPIKSLASGVGISNLRQGECLTVYGDRLYGWMPSGGVFCINGRTSGLEWVWSVPGYLSDNNNCPPGFIRYIGGQVVAFLPGQQLLVSLDKDTGALMWSKHLPELAAVHTDKKLDSNRLIVSVDSWGGEPRRAVVEINPWKGNINWIEPSLGVRNPGQGIVADNKIYVPAERGIAAYSDTGSGDSKWLAFPDASVRFADFSDGIWKILTDEELLLFGAKGEFSSPAPYNSGKALEHSKSGNVAFNPESKFGKPENIELEEIYVRTMTSKGSRGYDGRNLHLRKSGIPGYFCEIMEKNIAVYRESFYEPNGGQYVPGTLVWEGSFPSLSFRDGNRYLSSFTSEQAEFYRVDNGLLQLSYSPSFDGARTDRLNIESAGVEDGIGVVGLRNNYMVVFDLDAAKQLAVITPGKDQKFFAASSKYLVLQNYRNRKLSCYSIGKDNVKLLWTDKAEGSDYVGFFGDHLLLGHGGKLLLLDIKSGKSVVYKGDGGNSKYLANLFISGNNVYCSSNATTVWKAFSAKDGTPLRDLYRVAVCDDGAVVVGTEKVWWHGKGKAVELDFPKARDLLVENRNDRNGFYVALRSGMILMYDQTWLWAFSAENGELLLRRELSSPTENRSAMWGYRSLVLRSNDQLHCFGSAPGRNKVYSQVLNAVDGGGEWPSRGWLGKISGDDFSTLGEINTSGCNFSCGQDADNFYLHFRVPKPENNFVSRIVRIAALQANYKDIFDFSWNIDSLGAQAVSDTPVESTSWSVFDASGSFDYYLRIKKSKFNNILSNGIPVRFHFELEKYRSGRKNGAVRFGGVARGNAVLAVLPGMEQVVCQNEKNYQLRQKVYEKSPGFFLQGEDLVDWLATRRLTAGLDGNISFLQQALKRNAGYPCTVNILSALWLERLRKEFFAQAGIKAPTQDVLKRASEIAIELDKSAQQSGVDEACRKIALTMVVPQMLEVYLDKSPAPDYWRMHGGKREIAGGYFFRGDAYEPPAGIDGICLLPIGAFVQPALPLDLDVFTMGNRHWQGRIVAGAAWLVTPGKVTTMLNDLGKSENGFKLRDNGDYSLKVLPKQIAWCFSNKKRYVLEMPDIKFPKQENGKDLSKEAVLLALQNIPADSRNGMSLASRYLAMTKDDPKAPKSEEIYSLLLKRIGGSKANVNSIAQQMRREYYDSLQGENKTWSKADQMLRKFLSVNKINLQQIREIFIYSYNLANSDDKWLSLRIPPEQTGNLQPQSPEQVVDPLAGEYNTDDGTKLEFKKGSGPSKVFRELKSELITQYFALPVNAAKDSKAYFFVMPGSGRESEMPRVSAWLNGEMVIEDPEFSDEKTMAYKSMHFSKGDNVLLLKIVGPRYEPMYFSVGDRYGAPLDVLKMGGKSGK